MLIEHLTRQLRERDAQSLRRRRRLLASPCGPHVRLRDEDGGERSLLAFCSNDYLGLANHPQVCAALAQGALQWGAGSGASALVSGHLQPQAELEDRLAAWVAPHIPGARVLVFGTGYLANLALMTALGDSQASLHADKLNHASLVDGALLAQAPLQRYAHGRLDVLAAQLERSAAPVKLIVTDAVFSMDGNLADLPALLALAERHDAWLVVDDAHGFGVLGDTGRGTLQHVGLRSERVILMGTLGKAAGVAGAFVAAHPVIIEWLLQAARTAIYTTAPPPALAQALQASLGLIEGEEGAQRRARLSTLVALWRERAGRLVAAHPQRGWRLADSHTAIQPLVVGDNTTALRLSAWLETQGLWVPAIRPPTVPAGTARLRVSLSAAHTEHDLLRLVDALARALETMEVPA